MRRLLLPALLVGVAAGCRSAQPTPALAAEPVRALAILMGQRVTITPAYALRTAPDLGWGSQMARSRDVLRRLDADIAAVLDERGLRKGWVLPEDLLASYTRNPTYAADPYALAEESLRGRAFKAGSRLTEPLASQLRTLMALQDSRYVLAPVELRFEKVGSSARAALRLALLDARQSEAYWVGEVQSDTSSQYTPAMTASLAAHLADLITAP